MAVEKANEAKTPSMEGNKEKAVDEGLALESILIERKASAYEFMRFFVLV